MVIYLAGEILIMPKLRFMYIVPVDGACGGNDYISLWILSMI